ncbi:MAG: B12-binding domain-containing radical SAM protein [Spirochaetota bacterium]
MQKRIVALLINPWITDFAAYNYWSEPLGLLYIASILNECGAEVHYIDCLISREEQNPQPRKNGCSKYIRTIIEKPACLGFVPRYYARYGMSEGEFVRRLDVLPRPDVVLVTSLMTYWYPGVLGAIELVKNYYGRRIPVILGGIYARLCPTHAMENAKADLVWIKEDIPGLLKAIEGLTGKEFDIRLNLASFSDFPLPMHELQEGRKFFSILTGQGCPFRCSYCASYILAKKTSRRPIVTITTEITRYKALLNTSNVAFYDDALLIDPESHLIPLFEAISEEEPGLSLHLPNGIHASFITERIAHLMQEAGVRTIRIGLETSDEALQKRIGKKIENFEYAGAVAHLREAGYRREDIGTYVMVGLPGQTPSSVENTIHFIYNCGGAPHLSYFSPIPDTGIWNEVLRSSPFPIEKEPLFQNNTVFILGNRDFTQETIVFLKNMALEFRKKP